MRARETKTVMSKLKWIVRWLGSIRDWFRRFLFRFRRRRSAQLAYKGQTLVVIDGEAAGQEYQITDFDTVTGIISVDRKVEGLEVGDTFIYPLRK